MDTIIDEIRKILKGEKKTEFINQILKEKALTDALRQAGFTPSPEDAQERATERPFGVLTKIQKIDQLDLIKLVETIQKINQIDTIANLGTINQLNTIQQINKINPSATENVVIDRISKVQQIDNVSNIGSIGVVQAISDSLFSYPTDIIVNGGFEKDFLGWSALNVNIDTTVYHYGGKSAKFPPTLIEQWLTQHFPKPIRTNDVEFFEFWVRSQYASFNVVKLTCYYTDGTSTDHVFPVLSVNTWEKKTITLPTDKYLQYIMFTNLIKSSYAIWIDDISLLLKNEVKQTIRTNLRVMFEREDLLVKSWDLTSGSTTLLNAVSNKRHKIYGWDYEVDADGTTEFVATIGGATVKFGRRKTKGVHALTLIHPIICDVNTALSFQSAGNTSLSLRYITEA
jgi:hypothetical protein